MAAIESTMLELGTLAPAFRLPDFDNKLIAHDDSKERRGWRIADSD